MGKRSKRLHDAEDVKKNELPDVRMMALIHHTSDGKKEQRCPYCLSGRLRIIGYDLADENEKRFGPYKFIKKCRRCQQLCKVITDI